MEHSEFRRDLVSGEWILIAPARAHRPSEFKGAPKQTKDRTPKAKCPFEHPERDHIVIGGDLKVQKSGRTAWSILAIENRYPSVSHRRGKVISSKHGPFTTMPGAGHHELVITKKHDANFPRLSPGGAEAVLELLKERYLALRDDPNIAFISMFHNWGRDAGASVYHPHYQLVAIPVVPPDISRSLRGSTEYFHEKGKCVHCAELAWERKEKKRIVVESVESIALAPFVSRNPFEVRIFPKRHQAYFEETGAKTLRDVARLLQKTLQRVKRKLGNPGYNFFIHTAPVKGKSEYPHYHWHIEIFPKTSTRAGFEFGTGVETNIIDPRRTADTLRS